MSYILKVSRFGVDKATSAHPTFEEALEKAKALSKVYTNHSIDIANDETEDGSYEDGDFTYKDGLTDEERSALWEEI